MRRTILTEWRRSVGRKGRVDLSAFRWLAARTGFAAILAAAAFPAPADLPVARAALERTGVERLPCRMTVKPFNYKTNLWQSVEFVSGAKRILMSGKDDSVDINAPLRFGRLLIFNGRECQGELRLKTDSLWDNRWHDEPGDALSADPERNRATWSRPYMLPDGRKATFSYSVTGKEDGRAVVDYDMGISLAEAMAQTNRLPVFSCFYVSEGVGATSECGFGSTVHVPVPREEILKAPGGRQVHRRIDNPEGSNVFNFEPNDDLRRWTVEFPEAWVRHMNVMDFAGEERHGRLFRPVALHYTIADFRGGNPLGCAVKGRFSIDLGLSSPPREPPEPPVGGIDFWGQDAFHVSAKPTRNLIMNGSFEQGFKGWRWEDWGGVYTDAAELREGISGEGFDGRHSLLLRATQPLVVPLCSAPMPLVPGRTYTVSLWAKGLDSGPSAFNVKIRSVSRNGKYYQFRRENEFGNRSAAPGEWTRHSFSFTADAGGFYVQLQPFSRPLLVDAIQVEEGGEATEFTDDPFTANLVSSKRCNDFTPEDRLDLRLDVQARDGAAGEVRVRVFDFYREKKFDKSFALSGDATLPLDFAPGLPGKGVFLVRMDYSAAVGGRTRVWTDYARFLVQKPLSNSHPTAQFYANYKCWFERISNAEHMLRKFVEWGWGCSDGMDNRLQAERDVAKIMDRYGVRNYIHPVTYEVKDAIELADAMIPGDLDRSKGQVFNRAWDAATPERLAFVEALAYKAAKASKPGDDLWTFANEEEQWAKKIGFDSHVLFVEATMRGVRRAFGERGLPPPKFCFSHGTSHYFKGRNYDSVEGYLRAAQKRGFRYDAIAIHPYANIDGGILGPHDQDAETQHLIDQMREFGYPDSTPIYFSECFNILPYYIPQWGAESWGDSYRVNTIPSQDIGNREFLMAASQTRLLVIDLKYWPKVRMVHTWNAGMPILDIGFTPLSFVMSANTLGQILPSPEFFGDAKPYADVRGYCFRQDDHAVLAVWTTDNDVEWGLKKSPVVQMTLPKDAKFYDMALNEREPAKGTVTGDGVPSRSKTVRVPLTPAPLFIVSKDAAKLLDGLRNAVAENPATALSMDVKPDLSGRVVLSLENKTKAVQKGSLKLVSGGVEREIPYSLGELASARVPLAAFKPEPMKLESWSGTFSMREKPWEMKWFAAPRCGTRPDWSRIPAQRLESSTGRLAPGYAASFKAAWNADKFFVRVEVEDPQYVPYGEDGVAMSGDPSSPESAGGDRRFCDHDGCLEIHFDGFADARTQGEKPCDENDSSYRFLENLCSRARAVNWQLAQGADSATDREIAEKLERRFERTKSGYIYEIAFAARYMAPIELKAGSVAGLGICLHEHSAPDRDGRRQSGTLSNATRRGCEPGVRPWLMPFVMLAEFSGK